MRYHLYSDEVRGQFWVASSRTAAQDTRTLIGKSGGLLQIKEKYGAAYRAVMQAGLKKVDDNEAFLLARDLPWLPDKVREDLEVVTAAELAELIMQRCGPNFSYIAVARYLS